MRNRLLAGLDRLRQANERLGRFMNAAAGWLFVVCSLFVSFDVLARKFFNVSSRATVELTGYMLAFGIAWGLCDALTTRAHIRVDVLVTKMPLRLRAFMHALALGLGVGPRVARVYVGSAAAGRADEGSRMEGGG